MNEVVFASVQSSYLVLWLTLHICQILTQLVDWFLSLVTWRTPMLIFELRLQMLSPQLFRTTQRVNNWWWKQMAWNLCFRILLQTRTLLLVPKHLEQYPVSIFSPPVEFLFMLKLRSEMLLQSVLFGTLLHFFPCDLWWMDWRNFLIMVWVCFSFNHAQQARNCCISSCKWLWCSERCFEFRECEIPKVTCVNDSIDSIYQLWCHFDFHHFSVTMFLFWVRIFSIPRLLFGPFFSRPFEPGLVYGQRSVMVLFIWRVESEKWRKLDKD